MTTGFDMATLNEISEHLDMSVTRLKELLPRFEIDDKTNTDVVRVAYLRYLRNIASGRGSEDQQERLMMARARESELKGDKLEMDMAEAAGKLVPADAVEETWAAMIAAARAELLALARRLNVELASSFGVDVPAEFFEQKLYAALDHLAETDFPDAESGDAACAAELETAAAGIDD